MTKDDPAFLRAFDRQMLRSMVQSLFWAAIVTKRRNGKFTQQQLADSLGVNKSAVSRAFGEPQNWTLDKISDIASALGVDVSITARDRSDGSLYSASGVTPSLPQTIETGHVNSVRVSSMSTSVSSNISRVAA